MTRPVLRAMTIGYLVPDCGIAGVVHSVFAHAVNVAGAAGFHALLASPAGSGPTSLVLAPGPSLDLRRLFVAGETLQAQDGELRSPRAIVQLAGARREQRLPRRGLLPLPVRETRLRAALAGLSRVRATRPSVIDGAAAPALAALVRATREPQPDLPAALVQPLVGWGEGLTPACDDFLVGYLCGLEALASDGPRARFLAGLKAAIDAAAARTTVFGAHFLRLATRGHYATALVRLRDALLCNSNDGVAGSLAAAVQVGSTSGADSVSGLLAALSAWSVTEPELLPA